MVRPRNERTDPGTNQEREEERRARGKQRIGWEGELRTVMRDVSVVEDVAIYSYRQIDVEETHGWSQPLHVRK